MVDVLVALPDAVLVELPETVAMCGARRGEGQMRWQGTAQDRKGKLTCAVSACTP